MYGMLRLFRGSYFAKGLFWLLRFKDLSKLSLFRMNTFTELSAMPQAMISPVSLSVVQFTCLLALSKLIEPIEGSWFCLSDSLTYWRISDLIKSCSSFSSSGSGRLLSGWMMAARPRFVFLT